MNDERLRAYEHVTLVKVASVDALATAVPAPTDVKLQLAIVGHLVVGVEGAGEHRAHLQVLRGRREV